MHYKFKSGLAVTFLPLLIGLGVNCANADKSVPAEGFGIAQAQQNRTVGSTSDLFEYQYDSLILESGWYSQDLLLSDSLRLSSMASLSEPNQMVFAYADPSFSGLKNPEVYADKDSNISLAASVPLPTTTWCFLIGLMTILGISKRRTINQRTT